MLAIACCLVTMSIGGHDDLLKAIAAAYDENLAKFPRCQSELKVRVGKADGIAEARKDEFRTSAEGEGRFAFIPGHWIYEFNFSREALLAAARSTPGNKISGSLVSSASIADSRRTLAVRTFPGFDLKSVTRLGTITAGPGEFFRGLTVPLALGVPEGQRDDLASDLRSALTGGATRIDSVNDHEVFEGHKVVTIVVSTPDQKRTYWVDVERGAIPLRLTGVSRDGSTTLEVYLDDLQLVPGHGWYPNVRTLWMGGGHARRVQLLQPKWDVKDDLTTFRLQFDDPVGIFDRAAMLSYSPRKVWDLETIPKKGSADAAVVRDTPAPPRPALPEEREPSFVGRYLLFGGLATVGVVAIALWCRRR